MGSKIVYKGEFWHFFFFPIFKISSNFQIFKFSSIFVFVPFCELVRIWTLLLSIYIDSKDLQSNFEVPAVFGSTYFWVSLYKLPTVIWCKVRFRQILLYLKQNWKYDRELYSWGYLLGKVYIRLCTFHLSMNTVLEHTVKNVFNVIKKV